jgi:hypothetical protein
MAGMKFGFKELPANPSEAFPTRKNVFRPVIPVTIEYGGKKVAYEALLDSGADWNLFPSIMGEIIGIDIAKGKREPFGGIGGGGFTAYFHDVTLYIGGWPIKVSCGFSPDIPPQQSYGVLGHFGFFDRFIVRMDNSKKEIEIKKV